jgi:hypothetical protein
MRFRLAGIGALLGVALFEWACGSSSKAVSKFAASAVVSLEQGAAIFQDMQDSCVRTKEAQRRIDEFVAFDADARQTCKTSVHQDQLGEASKVLTDYFSTLGELASAGASAAAMNAMQEDKSGAAGSKTSAAGSKAGATAVAAHETAGGIDFDALQTASSALANLVASGVTNGVKERKLEGALGQANESVARITQALGNVVQNDYIDLLLVDERNKQAIRFQKYAENRTPPASLSDLLNLNMQWAQVTAAIEARRSSARAYVLALRKVRDGHAALLAQVKMHKTSDKDLEPVISTYWLALADLGPKIAKGF